ncbi:MAG: hypothetical protein U0990_00380 [Candidatus Nanopelagicales bacterium]|nr:hypothetical protein [Candidatus Nanopelagicales bacterium]MDZ4248530.1 hypothetical protein [Candidatus Nanopelagicales bacterium]MDZ7577308.1 hypothetical protein [Candidatus Nanopelagicales bacterium]
MSDKEDTNDKTAQDAPLTDEEAQSVQGGAAVTRREEAEARIAEVR